MAARSLLFRSLLLATLALAATRALAGNESELPASESGGLEQTLPQIFIGRSFTVRNFYRGSHLHYGSDGELTGKKDPGYWSRDGMVKISSVKLVPEGEIIFQGERYCVLFDPNSGEFANVKTGDKIEISVQLPADGKTMEIAIPVLYKVFLTGKDRLPDLVPSYWRDCLSQKVDRPNKNSPWECAPGDRQQVPDFASKKIMWDIPMPDRSLHNGSQLYVISHKIGYLAENGLTIPRVQTDPEPFFQWAQRRTVLDATNLVLALTVTEEGKAQAISIVSPVGMGLDDDAVQTVSEWKFSPGKRDGAPCAVHARIVFEINAPNTRVTPR